MNFEKTAKAQWILFIPMIFPLSALAGLYLFNSIPVLPGYCIFIAMAELPVGIILLISAKWRAIRSGKITFGSSELSQNEKQLYRAAYICFAIAILTGVFSSTNF
jgi:hypothetical protein